MADESKGFKGVGPNESSSDMKKYLTKKKPKGPSLVHRTSKPYLQKFIKSYSRNKIKTQLLTPLEKGERITVDYERDRRSKESSDRRSINPINDQFFFTRLSYSQSGKAIVQISLVHHKIPVNLALWPRQKNFRFKYKQGVLTGGQIENTRRLNIETLIVGLLSAKASESFIITNTNKKNILLYKTKKKLRGQRPERQNPLQSTDSGFQINSKAKGSRFYGSLIPKKNEKDNNKIRFNKVSYSNENQTRLIQDSNYVFGLEVEELSHVTLVTTFLVNTCNFYTKQILSRKLNKFIYNLNSLEIYEKEKLAFLEELNFEIENRFPFRSTSKVYEQRAFSNAPRAYWQDKISKELGFNDANFTDWYRIYIADPEEKSSNIEWVAPDEYYQNHPIKIVRDRRSINWSGNQRSGYGPLSVFQTSPLVNKVDPQIYGAKPKAFQKNNKITGFSESELEWSKVGPKDQPTVKSKIHNLYKQNKDTVLVTDDKSKKNLISFGPSAPTNLSTKTIKGWNKWKNNKTLYHKPVCWNNLDQLDQDFLYHTILLRCFNEAFCVIDENRELLDLIADCLLRFELLRQPKLLKVTDLLLN